MGSCSAKWKHEHLVSIGKRIFVYSALNTAKCVQERQRQEIKDQHIPAQASYSIVCICWHSCPLIPPSGSCQFIFKDSLNLEKRDIPPTVQVETRRNSTMLPQHTLPQHASENWWNTVSNACTALFYSIILHIAAQLITGIFPSPPPIEVSTVWTAERYSKRHSKGNFAV